MSIDPRTALRLGAAFWKALTEVDEEGTGEQLDVALEDAAIVVRLRGGQEVAFPAPADLIDELREPLFAERARHAD